MSKKTIVYVITLTLVFIMLLSSSCLAEKESFGLKVKNFWKTLLSYPARVTEESASVLLDTMKDGANVVTNGIKRASEVASGDISKTKELITEPITGTAETAFRATEGIIKIPSEAAKEKNTVEEEPVATESK